MSASPRGTHRDKMQVIRDCFIANEPPPTIVYGEMSTGMGNFAFDFYREHMEDIHPRALGENAKKMGDYCE